MTTGFRETSVEIIDLPKAIPDDLPYAIDDGSLAFHLGFRPKTMWFALCKPNQQYKVLQIPKRKRGVRIIHAPTEMMKLLLHRILIKFVMPLQEKLGSHVTAYRKGKSVRDAVLQHIPSCPFCDTATQTPKKHDCPRLGTYIHMDLKDFFPSTTRAWIRNFYKKYGYSHSVAGYLANLLTVKDIPNPRYKPGTEASQFFTGVPQGSPASGAICNLIANERLDKPLLRYFWQLNYEMRLSNPQKWVYTRYSDDLSFTCGVLLSREERQRVIEDVSKIIRESGYRIHKKKTKISYGYHRKTLLGIVFNQKPNIAKETYATLRAIVHNCATRGFETQYEKAGQPTPEALVIWLRGKIGWVKQINSVKGEKLLKEFDTALSLYKQRQEIENDLAR